MELTDLKYFTVLAEELHFGIAAKRLHITQPPLSRRIKALEEELELELFKRSSRSVELTEAGKLFYTEAGNIIRLFNSALEKMENYRAKGTGILRVRFNETAINSFLPEAISKFRRKYPALELDLAEMETAAQLDAMRRNLCDVAILRPYGFDISAFDSQLLLKEKYLIALHRSQVPCASRPLTLAEAAVFDFIMFPRLIHEKLYDRISDCFIKASGRFNVVQHTASKQTILALVSAGIGAALIPESNCVENPQIVYRHIENGLPEVEIFGLANSGNMLAAHFIDCCRR